MPPHACIAHEVGIKVRLDRLRASRALPVNFRTCPGRPCVICVKKLRTLVAKQETGRALLVQSDGHLRRGALNAKRAVRGRSVMIAKIAHWDLPEKEMTLMRRNADNVNWVKQHRLKVPLNAILVTLVNLAVAAVFVLPVPLVFIKMSKVKKSVLNVKQENCTSMLKRLVVGAI